MGQLQPKLYTELATWWPLFSPPSRYGEEAAYLLSLMREAADGSVDNLLELGCGGGSLAWHLKRDLRLTLSDRSAPMLEVSRAVNPECEHVLGDMRGLDLGRQFDLVLVHDAIMYADDAQSARETIRTAHRHCRPGGGVLIVPDCVRETFQPKTSTGGEDGPEGRALRYLEWSWDPDPADSTFETAFAFLLREPDGTLRIESDQHRLGLFPRAEWLDWMKQAGLSATSRNDRWGRDVFSGRR